MPAPYQINPNNAGTVELALAGGTLKSYACQVTGFQVVPTPNTTTRPGTYCAAPTDVPGASSWAIEVSFLQDWGQASRTVADAVTVSADATLESALANFTADDVGKYVTGAGIPAGTYIVSVTAEDEVELSANATASASGVTIVIGSDSLSEFTFENDGELIDFNFTSSSPDTTPSIEGQAYVVASPFGGAPGEAWQATTQRWSANAKPTLVPAA